MGGSKPKPSGAKPVRWSTRPKKQFKDLRPFLYSGPRARIDRYTPSNISGGGVQADVAAVSVEVDVGLLPGNAAEWASAQRVRATLPQSQRVRATLPPPPQTAPLMRR